MNECRDVDVTHVAYFRCKRGSNNNLRVEFPHRAAAACIPVWTPSPRGADASRSPR